MCLYAVTRSWNTLRLIKNPSEIVLKEAVKTKGWAIQYIESPLEELQLLAVERDWDSIKYIKNPGREVIKAAVEADWRAVQYIANPEPDIKRMAVKENEEAARYMDEMSEDEAALFIMDNLKAVKYIGDRIASARLEELLREKLSDVNADREYVRDFIKCDSLKLDKVLFIKRYGSSKAKAILLDYKLNI
jgi:hypothetical protein